MEKKFGLGKGLSALIPETALADLQETSKKTIFHIPTARVKDNQFQPRQDYNQDKLEDLKESIRKQGILQPILVREKNGEYEVIAGERRLKAARALGLEEIPVIVKNVSDQEVLVLALVENLQREDLNAIEEAESYKRLMDEFGFTQDQVAQGVGKNRSTVANSLRLLKLPENIQKSIFLGEISAGHARALLSLDSIDEQQKLFEQILGKDWSVRQAEQTSRQNKKNQRSEAKKRNVQSLEMVALEECLQKFFGTKVAVLHKKKRGKILIEYYSQEDLARIIGILKLKI